MREKPREICVSPFGPVPADWRVLPLGELTALMTNGFVGTATTHYVDVAGVTYVQGFNVVDGGFNLFGIKQVSQEFHNSHQKSRLCDGDLLTIQTGDVGLSTVVTPPLAGSNCHALIISRFKPKSADSRYYMRLFNSGKGRQVLRSIETGSTMKHLNVGDMLKLLVPVPPLQEQTAIADCVESAAEAIASLERLIAKKQAIKQGMVQQLLTGRTRLPGFTDEWRRRRLGELLAYEQPGRYLVSSDDYTDIGTPVLTAGKTFLLGHTTEQHGIFREVPVVIFDDFTTASKYVDFSFKAKSSAMKMLAARPGVNLRYVYERMQLIDFVPVDHKRRWIAEYSKIEVAIPDKQEQEQIASVLDDADAEIRLLDDRLSKARAIKTGMMQQLLTGRTRLPVESAS